MIVDLNKARAARAAKNDELEARKRAARNILVDWMESFQDLGAEFLVAEMEKAKEVALVFSDMTKT